MNQFTAIAARDAHLATGASAVAGVFISGAPPGAQVR